ncbi:ScbA/BarX family gamma-butyrolactone biosynthesis protein [Kitasatospora sp. NPDC052896]|uniref:ScbA/BarX family gamma-butyrolactone biosynthesis protein n=1 Tax=Kitasatospora sp. NPDC052896 TaxID=3364061 RepID=UPI0037C74969
MLGHAVVPSTDSNPIEELLADLAEVPVTVPGLSFQQPIPRHLVHRAAVAEVFLTDALRVGPDRFLVAAQWPRDHALYHPDPAGTSDPLLFAETIRQSLVYLAHRYYAVPLSHHFVGCDMDFEITDPEYLRVGAAPVPVVLQAQWSWEANRPPKRFGMRLQVVLTVDGRPCGRGSLRVVAVDSKRYSLLRGRAGRAVRAHSFEEPTRRTVNRLPAGAVGRLRSKDSVLARGERNGEWRLELDLNHAILFDHPGDHVPLMAVLEGFRQLGHLLVHRAGGRPAVLTSLAADCLAFGELDQPIHLVVRDDGRAGGPLPDRAPHEDRARRFRIDAVQGSTVITTATIGWSQRSRSTIH